MSGGLAVNVWCLVDLRLHMHAAKVQYSYSCTKTLGAAGMNNAFDIMRLCLQASMLQANCHGLLFSNRHWYRNAIWHLQCMCSPGGSN